MNIWRYFSREGTCTLPAPTKSKRVREKLKNCPYLQDHLVQTESGKYVSKHDVDAQVLSNEDLILERYLHTEFEGWENINFLDSSSCNSDVLTQSLNFFISTQHQSIFESDDNNGDDEYVLVCNDIGQKIQDNQYYFREQFYMEDKGKLKIKLYISDANIGGFYATAAKYYLSWTNRMPNYGFSHVGLIIGPWKLEFLDWGLVVPKQARSASAVVCVDLAVIKSKEQFYIIRRKLAKIIAEWNSDYTYKESGGLVQIDKCANCHQFVDTVLKELNLEKEMKKLPDSFQKYLQKLKDTGKIDMTFEPSKEFCETFQIDNVARTFHTHEELDLFVQKLFKKCPNFVLHYWDEYFLLKAFDRAFWLRYNKDPKNKKNTPLQDSKGIYCPFNNPVLTNSMLSFKEQKLEVE